jgi:DNA-binding PadR family transcriptional regulator
LAREKFQTLTEQMFYILLCLQSECYGVNIMEKIRTMTNNRVSVGPGTLYNLLENFEKTGLIRETKVEGRKRSYLITDAGNALLETEYQRLKQLSADYQRHALRNGGINNEDNKA